jgi:hypothetical protein
MRSVHCSFRRGIGYSGDGAIGICYRSVRNKRTTVGRCRRFESVIVLLLKSLCGADLGLWLYAAGVLSRIPQVFASTDKFSIDIRGYAPFCWLRKRTRWIL